MHRPCIKTPTPASVPYKESLVNQHLKLVSSEANGSVQSLQLPLPQNSSNFVGVNQSLPEMIHFLFVPDPNLLLCKFTFGIHTLNRESCGGRRLLPCWIRNIIQGDNDEMVQMTWLLWRVADKIHIATKHHTIDEFILFQWIFRSSNCNSALTNGSKEEFV